ncbi:MAG: hypothetical protein JWL98_1600 [Xanthomonadaceae bacterium]|nr:hypothetical protein [Xanthomonadaceae bacterium]
MRRIVAIAFCTLLLVACRAHNQGGSADDPQAQADASLPKPEAASGSVTGMPSRPGPGQIGIRDTATAPPDADTATPVAADETASDPDATDADASAPVVAGSANEPTTADAVAVVRNYYAAIDDGNYAHAWSLWSDGGRSSGQTLQQFADGFANTAHAEAEIGAPGNVEGAAGSRFVQVPVTLEATARDGSVQRYVGTYTLRRAVVDGATPEQMAWHIASATLRAASP